MAADWTYEIIVFFNDGLVRSL